MNSNPSQSENIDLKSFTLAISQIAEEKGISKEKVIETIEQAYAAAYKKDYGERGQVIRAKISPESGEVKFWQVKLVVDDSMILSEEELDVTHPPPKLKEKKIEREPLDKEKFRFNPEKHIMVKEAKKIHSKIKPGKEIEMALEAHKDYGRIAAQTAKQVILQKIREAEREAVFGEYKSKEGEIISGIVQRIEGNSVFLDIGKTLGILPREEQVPGEFYRPGQRIKVYILKVEETPRGPVVLLSRAYPKLISKLFELEVPEISTGQVLIKSIAREAGSRSKIAVFSETEGIDPIGAAVGQKGTRVGAVISELGGEKIDIIEYSEESEKFIANSLSPAKVLEVKIGPKNKAVVTVPEDQLSLAIGRDGQNVRLAAKLTGWKIDVRSPEGEKAEKGTKEKEETKEKGKEDKSSSSPLTTARVKEQKKKTKTVKK
ncbi:MAG: transcription termination/antitermination protein NusA [Candidatus Pacebacteria bacterium]|nr:transcription termination/antitermination protein NusA [Candidatus Paceibacterota bacterium]